jgi:hypothetical protein
MSSNAKPCRLRREALERKPAMFLGGYGTGRASSVVAACTGCFFVDRHAFQVTAIRARHNIQLRDAGRRKGRGRHARDLQAPLGFPRDDSGTEQANARIVQRLPVRIRDTAGDDAVGKQPQDHIGHLPGRPSRTTTALTDPGARAPY